MRRWFRVALVAAVVPVACSSDEPARVQAPELAAEHGAASSRPRPPAARGPRNLKRDAMIDMIVKRVGKR
jgi:hypothetical protein